VTPHYINREKTAERIARLLQDAKLIVILRNPIERAFFYYNMFKSHYGNLSFRSALERDRTLTEFGFYHRLLKNYYKYFDRDQFLILLYDDGGG